MTRTNPLLNPEPVVGVLLAVAAMLVPTVALSQEAAPASETTELEAIEVTGSRIKRVDVEGSLPVETVTRQEIERAGYQSVEELLSALSSTQNIGGTQLSTGAGSSTFGVSTVSMRGIGEDRTLVLVNGRRVAAQAGGGGIAVNINTLPLAAIERVEVLKDGASSVYGSDAVAGVVNFILRKDFTGLELAGSGGTPTREGGGDNSRYSLTGGYTTGRFNVMGSFSFEREKALFGRERDFAKNGTVLPFFVSGATGLGNIEGGYNPGDGVTPYNSATESARRVNTATAPFGSSPAFGYGNPMADTANDPTAPVDSCASIRMFLNPSPALTLDPTAGQTRAGQGAPFCAYDSAPDVGLIPDRELMSFTGGFGFKLADSLELFGDLLWAESEVIQAIQPSPLRRSFMTPSDGLFFTSGVDPVLLVRTGNPNYSIASNFLTAYGHTELVGEDLAITSRVFDFGPRTSQDTSTQTRGVLGLRGDLMGEFDYEVALSHNESKLEGTVTDGYFSQVAFARVVNNLTTDWNPWSLTQSGAFQSALDASGAKYVGPTLNAKSSADTVEGLVRGDLMQMDAGALQFAAGASFRQEDYKNSPSAALETGDIAGLGGAVPPVDRDRSANAIYAEVNVPVLENLEAGAGLRFDDYDDVGSATTYKLSAGYRPARTVLLRATAGSGFRAPSLEELYEPQTVGTSEQFDDPATGVTDLQVPSTTGGNPELNPEESTQTSLGLVWQASDAVGFSVDMWSIRIEEAITSPSAQLVVSRFRAGDAAYQDLVEVDTVTNNITAISQFLVNTGELKVDGYDLGMEFRQSLGASNLNFSVNGTYLDRFDETTPSGDVSHKVATTVDPTGAPVIGADGGGVALRWKHTAALTWSMGEYSATLVQNFYKGYEMGNDLNGQRQFVPSVDLYDASFAYTGLRNTTIGIGMRNIFDDNPPIFVPASNQFQSGYDAALEDPRRQFVYLTANYKFF